MEGSGWEASDGLLLVKLDGREGGTPPRYARVHTMRRKKPKRGRLDKLDCENGSNVRSTVTRMKTL